MILLSFLACWRPSILFRTKEKDEMKVCASAGAVAEKLFFESRLEWRRRTRTNRKKRSYISILFTSAAGTIYFPSILHGKHFKISGKILSETKDRISHTSVLSKRSEAFLKETR